MGLGVAFYLLPYEPACAREMYEAWVAEKDLRNHAVEASPAMLGTSQFAKLGLILAQEFGDSSVAAKIRTVLDVQTPPATQLPIEGSMYTAYTSSSTAVFYRNVERT